MGDELFPDSVKDFVFDLHDAARRSFIPSEQQALYLSSFREITAKVRACDSVVCRLGGGGRLGKREGVGVVVAMQSPLQTIYCNYSFIALGRKSGAHRRQG